MLASPLRHPRIGFVVPKYGHSAVERNRLRRQLREIVRVHILGTLSPLDAVVKAQRNTYAAPFSALMTELISSMTVAEQRVR